MNPRGIGVFFGLGKQNIDTDLNEKLTLTLSHHMTEFFLTLVEILRLPRALAASCPLPVSKLIYYISFLNSKIK